jgi:serine/threonine protein kinase
MSTSERRVGRYQIIRQIGRGGMAIVYLARQETLERDVALKELSSFHASAPEMAQRFLQESRLAGSLNHPNIVTVLEYFEDDGVPYIAMEYVRRGSLRPYVSRLSTAQFVGVMEGVLAGLAHAETHGIVHRDLKPENIMVTADGRVKITDFGIAKATAAAGTGVFLTAAGTTVGTPTYMAPEQAMGRDIGIWTDLYSVGVMAWEHVVGRVPFYDSEVPMVILTRQLNEEIPAAVSVNPDADPDLSDWIDKLLVKDPVKRAQSPALVWDDLEEIIINRLGPRWRREARLPSPSQVFDTPHPLTPAPFESSRVRTPEPAPSPEPEPAGLRDTPGQTPPETPAAEPAIAAEEALPEPKPGTGYVTFGPARDVAAPAAAAAAAEAIATPAPPVATPDSRDATPEAKADAPVAEPETPPAPVEPPERHEPTYVTYGRAPEPMVPVEPAPEPAPEPEPPVPEAVTEPRPEPVAEAAPALDGETLPGLGQSALEPAAEEPIPEPEPTEPEPTEPEPELREPGPPQPETARAPRPARDVIVRRRAILAGVVGVIAAAAIGFAIAPKGGGGASTTAQTAAQPLQHISSGPISVSIPAGWQRQSPSSNGPGLQLQNQIAVGPSAPAGGKLVIGNANTTDPSLLPNALLTTLPGGAPGRQVVKVGGSQFYRYLDLQLSGVNGPVSVYALPTTTAGTVLAACFLQGAAASFPADCERVLGSLRLVGASPAGLGPNSSLAAQLSATVGTLNKAVSAGQARLHSARKPGQQATAASQLAAAYSRAASAVRKLAAPSPASAAVAGLAASLAKTGHDYAALSRAASHSDGHRYTAASNAIGADGGSVSAAFAQLAKLGYAS